VALVDYAHVGRLLVWVDGIRTECGYILDAAARISVLVHESFGALAEGLTVDNPLEHDRFAELRLAHGLDRRLV
jgi:hypothetical protein